MSLFLSAKLENLIIHNSKNSQKSLAAVVGHFVGLTFQPHFFFIYTWSSLVAQTVKRPLIMRELYIPEQ